MGTKIGCACKRNFIGACAYKPSVFFQFFFKIASDSLTVEALICGVIE